MRRIMAYPGASDFSVLCGMSRHIDDRDTTPYEDLANAIIVQATKDYRAAKANDDQQEIRFITKFFHGGWYATLTKVDPDYILERL